MPERPVRRAKIVATLGPATDGLERDLVARGLDVARLNFSHGTPEDHARRAAAIRAAAREQDRWVAVMQDLQGPKIRVGRLAGGGPVDLVPGRSLTITTEDIVGNADRVSCAYAGLPDDVRPGDRLLLDDGRLRLTVTAVEGENVETRVEKGGPLGEHKGINLPGIAVSAPALTEKDRADLRFGLQELGVDYVALSFVRNAREVHEARALARTLASEPPPLIVKLEKGEAIADLENILDAADGVMVARGDLGVELAPEQVPPLQKQIIRSANRRGLPVITATQMLESMMQEEVPTRAEASDVANAVWDGTDAVMLSGETAAGRHPLLVLEMMDRIVRTAETVELPRRSYEPDELGRSEPAAAVTRAASLLAEELGATAIVAVTRTGRTAELFSRGRVRVPLYAFSAQNRVARRLALWWGVVPVHSTLGHSTEQNTAVMASYLLRSGSARAGDTVVIAGSLPFHEGVHTNYVKYQVLGEDPDASRLQ